MATIKQIKIGLTKIYLVFMMENDSTSSVSLHTVLENMYRTEEEIHLKAALLSTSYSV